MTKCPCHLCEHRTITCHGFCEDYKEWKAENDERLKKREERRKSTPNMPKAMLEYIWRNIR